MTYKIGKTKAIYVSDWSYEGVDFKIHRPVLPDGRTEKEGWQFSIDGVPIHKSPCKTKAQATSSFRKKCKSYNITKEVFKQFCTSVYGLNHPIYF